jgi:hypothetical protein
MKRSSPTAHDCAFRVHRKPGYSVSNGMPHRRNAAHDIIKIKFGKLDWKV